MRKKLKDFILKVYELHPNFLFIVNFIFFILIIAFVSPSLTSDPDYILRLNLRSLRELYINSFGFIKSPFIYLIFSLIFGSLFYLGNIFLSWIGIPLFYVIYFFLELTENFTLVFTKIGTQSFLNLPLTEHKGFSIFLSQIPHTLFLSFGYFLSLVAGLIILLSFSTFIYRILKNRFPKIKPLTAKIIVFIVIIIIPHLLVLYFISKPLLNDIKLFSLRGPVYLLLLVYFFSIGNHFFSLVSSEIKKYKDLKPREYLVENLKNAIYLVPFGLILVIIGIILENTLSVRVLMPLFNKINVQGLTLNILNIITAILYAASVIVPFWFVFFKSKKWSKVILSTKKESKKKKK
ncbi:MAG: hypothetical protein ACPLWB_01930 [Caldisericia bacterium]